ncbi:hypothetical protein IWZ00DRAFT_225430 [Phyllosticta capitalensis]|uniref:Uncharacterized protein n=1 Tax=Phyllosticta capitalensis TaxID=121624 RepID=A0ABR1YRR3_9PEZI
MTDTPHNQHRHPVIDRLYCMIKSLTPPIPPREVVNRDITFFSIRSTTPSLLLVSVLGAALLERLVALLPILHRLIQHLLDLEPIIDIIVILIINLLDMSPRNLRLLLLLLPLAALTTGDTADETVTVVLAVLLVMVVGQALAASGVVEARLLDGSVAQVLRRGARRGARGVRVRFAHVGLAADLGLAVVVVVVDAARGAG